MNVQTYLDSRYTGEVIGSRRVLAAMKRKGLISDYSEWCYLESHKVYYVSEWKGEPCTDYYYMEFGKEPKPGELGSYENPYRSADEMWEALPPRSGFYYRGHYFTMSYLDGCFKPYLIITNPPQSKKKDIVKRTMSVFGAVV